MGTKFASYTLKLASLHEYYQRLLIGSQPVPSGIEMANTLKYFFQALLSLLKDVEKSPYEMLKFQNLDMERLALYPNLDYKQLFNALSQLIDVIPSVNIGLSVLGQALLQCLACLLPFLDHDLIDSLPFLTASLISVLPEELHQDIINYLCYYVLPFTIGRKVEEETENYATQSISAVIMVIFEYSKDNTHHCQLLECLMALKSGIIKDILCVIAYGTSYAMTSAANLLFYYWPMPYCNLCDQRAIFPKFPNEPANFLCQRDECSNAVNSEAAKVCFNHSISIEYATDSPPPLYLCIECANEIHRANPNQMFFDILHPMQQISLICENKAGTFGVQQILAPTVVNLLQESILQNQGDIETSHGDSVMVVNTGQQNVANKENRLELRLEAITVDSFTRGFTTSDEEVTDVNTHGIEKINPVDVAALEPQFTSTSFCIVPSARFITLAHEITTIFKYENETTYYTPSQKFGKKFVLASGKLWNHFNYVKDCLRQASLLAGKEEIAPVEINGSNNDDEKINWLSSNIDPWTDIVQYWNETYAVRRTLYLLNTDFTVQDYFDKFKCLSTQEGKELAR